MPVLVLATLHTSDGPSQDARVGGRYVGVKTTEVMRVPDDDHNISYFGGTC